MIVQLIGLLEKPTHETPRLEDLHRVKLLHEGPSSKETTKIAPVVSPELISRHQNCDLVPARQLRYHLELRPLGVILVALFEHLSDILAVVDDNEASTQDRVRGNVACSGHE